MKIRYLLITFLALLLHLSANGQKVALKTNLLGDAFLSPNVALEMGVAPRWTVDLSGQFNFWPVNEHNWKHWVVQPEARYWFCRRFTGHFLGVHALGGEFNVGNIDMDLNFLGTDFRKLKNERYEGWGVGAGVAYGYAWPIHPGWNVEAEVGVGWVYTRSSSYPCATCGTKISSDKPHNYVGPTKAAINIVYFIK